MRIRARVAAALLSIASLFMASMPAGADPAIVKQTAIITGTSTNVAVSGLAGQSSCTIEINGTASGTVQGIEQGVPVSVKAVQIPDGGTPSASITGPGQFTANCAGMQVFQFVPTAVTGSVTITIIASGAVGRIIGAGVNNGVTSVVGNAPISVTNSGSTATIGITNPLPILNGGTGATALPTGCLQSNGTAVSSTGVACGGAAGVTAVTGTGNIAVTAGATPVVSITNSPTFSGLLTTNQNIVLPGVGGSTTIGYHVGTVNGDFPMAYMAVNNLGSNDYSTMGPLSTSSVSSVPGTCWNWQSDSITPTISNIMALDCSGNLGTLGAMHATSFFGSGANLTSGTVPNAALVTAPVTSVSGTGNITSTGGTTPTVAITDSPTFAGTITNTALSNQRCVTSNSSKGIVTSPRSCPIGVTAATFVIPALGSTVAITTGTPAYWPDFANTPVFVTDGTNTMLGVVTAGQGTTTLTVKNAGMMAGAIGNTMATSAEIGPGGDGASLLLPVQGGTRLNGIHTEMSAAAGIAVGATTTATFTYSTGFTAAPTCMVGTIGALAPTMSLNATPGTSSAVIFNSATAGTASITCTGW